VKLELASRRFSLILPFAVEWRSLNDASKLTDDLLEPVAISGRYHIFTQRLLHAFETTRDSIKKVSQGPELGSSLVLLGIPAVR